MKIKVETGKGVFVGECAPGSSLLIRGNKVDVSQVKSIRDSGSSWGYAWELELCAGSKLNFTKDEAEGSFTVVVEGLAQPVVVNLLEIHSLNVCE